VEYPAMNRRSAPVAAGEARGDFARVVGYALLGIFFALAQLRLIILLMPKPFVLSAQAIEGVLAGEPHWRIYQSRVLAPWLVEQLTKITHADIGAYAVFTVIALAASGFLVLFSLDRLRDPARNPLVAFLMLQIMFVFLLPSLWLYGWDLLSILAFVIFNALVLRGAGRLPFVVLYAIAIFNHEVAQFIAGWLMLDPIVRWLAGRGKGAERVRFDWRTSLVGAVLVAAGAVLIGELRSRLLVHETGTPSELPPLVVYGKNFHLAIAQNWQMMTHSLSFDPASGFMFVIELFLIAVVGLAIALAIQQPARFGALAIVTIGMMVSSLFFGLIAETRVLMPLIPFVAMNGWSLRRR
jgi:hypothetical protein